jgi:hypothetical protein
MGRKGPALEFSKPTSEVDEPSVARPATIGAVIGFVGVTAGVAATAMANGLEPGAAIGLGAYVGMWGGAGFGFMLGATTTLARAAEQRQPHR